MFKKKILSVVLAIAICFTMVAGSLSALADAPIATYSVSFGDVENNEVTATVTINNSDSTLAVALVKLDVTGLTVTGVSAPQGFAITPSCIADGTPDYSSIVDGKLNILVEVVDIANPVSEMSFGVTFNVSGVTSPTFAIDSIEGASTNENATTSGTAGDIAVTPAEQGFDPSEIEIPTGSACLHSHLTYTNITDTTHNVYCEDCKTTIETGVAHVYNSGVCVCGKTEPAPVCTHENKTVVTATPATESANGSITFKCDDCGETFNETVLYHARNKCYTAKAAYESAITLRYSARVDRLNDIGTYTNAFVRFSHVLSSTGEVKETISDVSEATDGIENTRSVKTWSYPVRSTQLTETVNSNAFVEIDGVWYSGETFGYSIRSYVDTILAQGISLSEQKLVVNMLRYGSRMQVFREYNTENLADANLGEYASLIMETQPTIEGLPTRVSTDNNAINIVASVLKLDMASKTEAIFTVRSDRYTKEPAKDDFTIVASWTNANGVSKSVTYYNELYAEDGQLTYGQDPNNSNPGRYGFHFAELCAYDLRQTVNFYLYDGDTEVSQGFSASIENIINYGIQQGTYGATELAVYYALLNYSDCAREHFKIN